MSKRTNIDLPRTGNVGYYAVQSGGHMKCSCGRPLIKVTDKIWRCSYGWPEYNIDEGDWYKDKFGNFQFKAKSHDAKRKASVRGNRDDLEV